MISDSMEKCFTLMVGLPLIIKKAPDVLRQFKVSVTYGLHVSVCAVVFSVFVRTTLSVAKTQTDNCSWTVRTLCLVHNSVNDCVKSEN